MRRGLRLALEASRKDVERCEANLERALAVRADVIREADGEGEAHTEIGKIVNLTRGRVWQIANGGTR